MKKKLAGLAASLGLALTLVVAPGLNLAPSSSAEAARPISCRYITLPATAPWWQCINLNPTKPGNPYCSPKRVYRCG
jgi:hypothetical protein